MSYRRAARLNLRGRAPKGGALLTRPAENVEESLHRSRLGPSRGYRRALEWTPGFLPAQKALVRAVREARPLVSDLVGVLESDLLQTTDRELQVTTLHRIAAIHEDRLGDVPRAVDALKWVTAVAPQHVPTMHDLGRLDERSAATIQLHDTEARQANDTKQAISLGHQNSRTLRGAPPLTGPRDSDWEKVLQLAPTYQPALRALGRLYTVGGTT